jgi:transposase
MLTEILAEQLYGGKGHGWRIAESWYDYVRQHLVVRLVPTRGMAFCSCCGAAYRHPLDTKNWTRSWRHRDAWGVRTIVVAPLRRVRCRRCGIRVEKVPWADVGARLTRHLEEEVLDRARETSIQGVCRQLGLHGTTVMRLVERWVRKSAEENFRRPLRRIGVDEVSYGRGQRKYLTIVWDHDRGQVVWIGKGREEATLAAFFARLGHRRARRLVCVTMDMAAGYIAAVRQHAPQADIVFDRFHIEHHLLDAVDEVRKQEFWRGHGRRRDVIRGKKYLLLQRRKRLHWRRRRELDDLLRLNKRLNAACVLKEQFAKVWEAHDEDEMATELERWRRMLRWKRLGPLQHFWQMLVRHEQGVLAWARHRMTNAALEGNNARVRALSHRAHGYRNPDHLIVILYHASWRQPLASPHSATHPNAR